MILPDYFNSIKPIILKDDLAKFLGTSMDGELEIHYSEIAKMAGHSCVTVAGAWLMAEKGLKALYGDALPVRGQIKVELRDSDLDGSNGVSGAVFSNITGAAGLTGFSGLGGNFNRRNLLSFNVHMDGFVRFTRMDTNKSVELKYRPADIVHPGNILMTAIGPKATDESRAAFPKLWLEMIKQLFDNVDDIVKII